MGDISRRQFVKLAATTVAAAPAARPRGTAAVTAADVVDRVKKTVGPEWKSETVDTFKAGESATVVTSIVTTSMATMDVLRQTVTAGANLVITCEPTFYAKADSATPPPRRGAGPGDAGRSGSNAGADPIFAAKDAFIRTHNLVIWRFSDHWRLHKPDPLAEGLTDALGWSRFKVADDPTRVSIPDIRLDALVSDLKRKLHARGGIRVVGDPHMKVRSIGILPGTTPIRSALATLPGVDVIIAGEVREWESVEYARDSVTVGGKKGLILLGRVLSEEPGMNVCAQWLKTLVPEVQTTWVPVGDPYWRPL